MSEDILPKNKKFLAVITVILLILAISVPIFILDTGGDGDTDEDGEQDGGGSNGVDDESNDNGGGTDNGTVYLDNDNDGLTNINETEVYGTDPNCSDTSGNGIGDGESVAHGLDPTKPYTKDFVGSYKKIKQIGNATLDRMIETILNDGNISSREDRVLNDTVQIDNLEVLEKLLSDFDGENITGEQADIFSLFADLSEFSEHALERVNSQYFTDGKLNGSERQQLRFLKNNTYDLAEAFLTEGGEFGEMEVKYLKKLMENEYNLSDEIAAKDYHGDDGAINEVEWNWLHDLDFDGLSNREEIEEYGTDPQDEDSDDDGLDDDAEIEEGTDNFDNDTDGDGLGDGAEVHEYGTNPLKKDTFDDGLPDRLVVEYGLDPEKEYPGEFSDAMKYLDGNLTVDLIEKFIQTVYDEKNLSAEDYDLVEDLNQIREKNILGTLISDFENQHITDEQYRTFGILGNLSQVSGSSAEKIASQYFNDENLTRAELEKLAFIDSEDEMKEFLKQGGRLGDNESLFVGLNLRDRHNISEQILKQGYHDDGKINATELNMSRDVDSDGLIRVLEGEIGTDYLNPDTDKDGLLDGWEVYGVRRKNSSGEWLAYVPLQDYGADPLHKDLFVELVSEGDAPKLNKSEKLGAVASYREANVSNPDGTKGITLHLDDDTEGFSLGGSNLLPEDFWNGPGWRNWLHENHPRFGLFRMGVIAEWGKGHPVGTSNAPGHQISLNNWSVEKYNASIYLAHELGHNVLGILDERNWDSWEDHEGDVHIDKYHSKYVHSFDEHGVPAYYLMSSAASPSCYPRFHDNVSFEMSRDGLLGLPFNLGDYDYGNESGLKDAFGEWGVGQGGAAVSAQKLADREVPSLPGERGSESRGPDDEGKMLKDEPPMESQRSPPIVHNYQLQQFPSHPELHFSKSVNYPRYMNYSSFPPFYYQRWQGIPSSYLSAQVLRG